MCLICVEYEKEKLTLKEAWTNLGEMYETMDPEHRAEVSNMLMEEALFGEEEIDEELWQKIFQGVMM
jgi:hypothetical protein